MNNYHLLVNLFFFALLVEYLFKKRQILFFCLCLFIHFTYYYSQYIYIYLMFVTFFFEKKPQSNINLLQVSYNI